MITEKMVELLLLCNYKAGVLTPNPNQNVKPKAQKRFIELKNEFFNEYASYKDNKL